MTRIGAVLASLLLATGLWAQDRAQVVAVNYPLQYFTERLLGDGAEVSFPVPAEVDPSFWRPTISDISAIQSADLILLNGAGFATWIDRVTLSRAKVANTSALIEDQFIVTESITHSHGDGGEHSHEGGASYLWLDPTLAMAQADAVAEAITQRGLAPEDEVAVRLEELRADLTALDDAARTALAEAPETPIIATHPRYEYFARAYGLTIEYLEWEAGAAPDDAQLAELAEMAAQTGAEVLIWEAAPPNGSMDAVAELGLRSVVFPPLVHAPQEGSYGAAFARAVDDLSQALKASAP